VTAEDKADVTDVDGVDDIDAFAADESSGATEVTGSDTEITEEAPASSDRPARRSARGMRRRIGVILLAAALVASAGLTGWLFFYQYRPDKETDSAAAKIALEAAKNGTVALLSYSPDSLDKDFASAKTHLTGDFLSYYTQFTEQIVTPAAKQKSVKTTASVVRAAVSEIHPESAIVLVFVNQTTTSKENPDGAFAASSVKVGMKKIDGAWLISTFDPV
jgi:Mce-associated membrane protein